MGGDVLENVLNLLIEETIDFEYRRKFLRKVLEKGRAFDQRVNHYALTMRLNSGELDAAIDKQIE